MRTPGKFTANDRLNLELEMDHARLASLTDEQFFGSLRSVTGLTHQAAVLGEALRRIGADARARIGGFASHATFAEDTH